MTLYGTYLCRGTLSLLLLMLRGTYCDTDCNSLGPIMSCRAQFNQLPTIDSLVLPEPYCDDTNTRSLINGGRESSLECKVPMGLTVMVEGWDLHTINGVIEDVDDSHNRFTEQTNRLEITGIQSEDEGVYVCRYSANGVETTSIVGCLIVTGTVEFASSHSGDVTYSIGGSLRLPTELSFPVGKAGPCNIQPTIISVQLQHDNSLRIVCSNQDCGDTLEGIQYDINAYGNVVILNATADDAGEFMFGVEAMCPNTVLQREFTAVITTPSSTMLVSSVTDPSGSDPVPTTKDSSPQTAIVAGVVAVVVILSVVTAIVVIVPLSIFLRRKGAGRVFVPSTRDPLYDNVKPVHRSNGSGHMHGHIERDDSDLYAPPSTIIGDRHSVAYDEVPVYLQAKPSDQEGSV